MPAIIFLKRSWSIASDDFVFPSVYDIVIRVVAVLLMLVSYFATGSSPSCFVNLVSLVFFGIVIGLQFLMIILNLVLSILSGRGGIMEVAKRTHVPSLLLTIFLLSMIELPIHCVNIYFATTYELGCSKIFFGAFIAGNVLRLLAIIQYFIYMGLHFRKSGIFWSRIIYEDRPTQKGYIPRRTSQSMKREAHEVLSRSIQRRLKRLTMFGRSLCANREKDDTEQQMAINSAAALFSEVFYDVNLVTSDIVAGLLLLRWQTAQWVGSGHRVPFSTIELQSVPCDSLPIAPNLGQQPITVQAGDVESVNDPDDSHTWLSIERLQRIAQIGISIYGKLFYYYMFRVDPICLCRLCGHTSCATCTNRSNSSEDHPDIGCCICSDHNCDFAAVLEISGLPKENFITVSFDNTVYLSPYFVAVDDHSRCIIVAVRGTLSFEDAIVDLLYDGVRVEEIETVVQMQTGKRPTFVAHRGMVGSARRLFQRLIAEDLIEKARRHRPGYTLVVCGHSLGAGIASVLTLLLRPLYPDVKGYALSSPLGIMNTELSDYAKPFLLSIVYGFDAFARMNRATVMDFKWRLVDALTACNVPKHRLLCRGAELCIGRCCYRGCSTCCYPCLPPITVGHDTQFLTHETQQRLIHPEPDLRYSIDELRAHSPSGTGDVAGPTVSCHWPSRLSTEPRSLLSWMNPKVRRLFWEPESNCTSEETICSSPGGWNSTQTATPSPSDTQTTFEMRDAVFGGLVLHVLDVDLDQDSSNLPTDSQPSHSNSVVLRDILVNEEKCCCSSSFRSEATVAVWTDGQQFQTLLIHPRMFTDHMPHNLLRAINRLYASVFRVPNFAKEDIQPVQVFRKVKTA